MTSPERSHPNLPWLTSADGYIAAKHSHDLEAEAGLKQGEAALATLADMKRLDSQQSNALVDVIEKWCERLRLTETDLPLLISLGGRL